MVIVEIIKFYMLLLSCYELNLLAKIRQHTTGMNKVLKYNLKAKCFIYKTVDLNGVSWL